jgi:gluconate 2-dehydrogenase gamma chain
VYSQKRIHKEAKTLEKRTMEKRTINRRDVLQGLLLSVGYAGGLAACSDRGETELMSPVAGDGASEPRYYSRQEFSLVSKLADGLIPTTDTPGAIAAGVPMYLDALMADWASTETQAAHHEIVAVVEQEFATLSLEDLDAAAFGDRREELGAYRQLKNLISNAYYVSEPGSAEEAGWIPVPGRWEHCVPIEEVTRVRGG